MIDHARAAQMIKEIEDQEGERILAQTEAILVLTKKVELLVESVARMELMVARRVPVSADHDEVSIEPPLDADYCEVCRKREKLETARNRLGLGKFGGLDLAETIFRGIYNKLTWGKRT